MAAQEKHGQTAHENSCAEKTDPGNDLGRNPGRLPSHTGEWRQQDKKRLKDTIRNKTRRTDGRSVKTICVSNEELPSASNLERPAAEHLGDYRASSGRTAFGFRRSQHRFRAQRALFAAVLISIESLET